HRGAVPVTGAVAILYRLHDVAYEIQLERVNQLLAVKGPDRARPTRGEAQAIRIPNPPITVPLATETVEIQGRAVSALISARIFDFGVVSLRARIEMPA